MSTALPNLHVSNHPLVRHKLVHMQNRHISSQQFYRLMKELGMLLAYEATAHLAVAPALPFVPDEKPPDGQVLAGPKPVIVPVLRSGLAMAEGFREVIPLVRTGHLGILQGKHHDPREYLIALPEMAGRPVIVLDAIIATGRSAVKAMELLKDEENVKVPQENVVFCVALATEDGVKHLLRSYPQVRIIAGDLARTIPGTNDVTPWLGHIGNRLFFGIHPEKVPSDATA